MTIAHDWMTRNEAADYLRAMHAHEIDDEAAHDAPRIAHESAAIGEYRLTS